MAIGQQAKKNNLVENKKTYTTSFATFNMYETKQVVKGFQTKMDNPYVCCMISGEKIMHLGNTPQFKFSRGETLVCTPQQKVLIDFPSASLNNPTRCITFELEQSKINEAINLCKQSADFNKPTLLKSNCNMALLQNTNDIKILLNRLAETFSSAQKNKDILIDLMFKELVVRLMQTHAKYVLLNASSSLAEDDRISIAVKYIKEHITENLTVEKLANQACMSSSHFFKVFKNILGLSPIDFVNAERIRSAKKLLIETTQPIGEIAAAVGFNNTSYFNRQFKKSEHITPAVFRNQQQMWQSM